MQTNCIVHRILGQATTPHLHYKPPIGHWVSTEKSTWDYTWELGYKTGWHHCGWHCPLWAHVSMGQREGTYLCWDIGSCQHLWSLWGKQRVIAIALLHCFCDCKWDSLLMNHARRCPGSLQTLVLTGPSYILGENSGNLLAWFQSDLI